MTAEISFAYTTDQPGPLFMALDPNFCGLCFSFPPGSSCIEHRALTTFSRTFLTILVSAMVYGRSPPSPNQKQCCNHPFLNRGVEERILSEIPDELHTKANVHKQLVDASGKVRKPRCTVTAIVPRLVWQWRFPLVFFFLSHTCVDGCGLCHYCAAYSMVSENPSSSIPETQHHPSRIEPTSCTHTHTRKNSTFCHPSRKNRIQ